MKFMEFVWSIFGRGSVYRAHRHQQARSRWAELVEKERPHVWLRGDKKWIEFNKVNKSEEYK